MVMTLRKRNPPITRNPSPPSSPERESLPRTRKAHRVSRKPAKENAIPDHLELKNEQGGLKYEDIREQRIRENREKMEKLGIFQLLKTNFPKDKKNKDPVVSMKRKNPPRFTRSCASGRRSDRLKNVPQAKYSEGSDVSAEWLETESDDEDSTAEERNVAAESDEEHAREVSIESVDDNDDCWEPCFGQ